MTDTPPDTNVHALNGADIASDRRREFLNDVASAFDAYTKDFETEPEAIVFVLGGIAQWTRAAYTTTGTSQSGATSMLALASATILKRVVMGPGE